MIRSAPKAHGPQAHYGGKDASRIQVVSQPENITSRYSLYQPDGDDKKTSTNSGVETNVSAVYFEVNKTRKVANYDQVLGEAAHFTVDVDYDHVFRHSYDGNSCDDVTGRVTENADVDMTYNQLHRGMAAPARSKTEADPYDVLNRINTRT